MSALWRIIIPGVIAKMENITYEEHARVMRSLGVEPASKEAWEYEKSMEEQQ